MADVTHITRYEVEDLASKALATLRTETKGLRDDFVAGAFAAQGLKDSLGSVETGFDEVKDKLRDARNRMMEFGFSSEAAGAGLDLIMRHAALTQEPIALTALRMEELAKETQNSREAFELWGLSSRVAAESGEKIETATGIVVDLARETGSAEAAARRWAEAQQLAARTGQRAVDALTDLNQAARGSTTALRNLSNRGKQVADAIDRISSPTLRAKVAMRETRHEIKRSQTGLEQLQDRYQLLQVDLARMGPMGQVVKGGFLAGAAGAAAFIAMIGRLTQRALKAYIKTTPTAAKASKKFDKSLEEVEASLGGVIAEVIDLDGTLHDLTGTNQSLSASFRESKDEIVSVISDMGAFNDVFAGAIGPVASLVANLKSLIGTLRQVAKEIRKARSESEGGKANAAHREGERQQRNNVDRLTAELINGGPSEDLTKVAETAVAAGIRDGSIPLDIEGRPVVTVVWDDDGTGFQLDTSRQASPQFAEGFVGVVPDISGEKKKRKKGSGGGGSKKKNEPFNPVPLGPGHNDALQSGDDIIAQEKARSAEINRKSIQAARESVARMELEDAAFALKLTVQPLDIDAIRVQIENDVAPLVQAITEFKTAANGGLAPEIPEETERLIEQYQRATHLIQSSDKAFTDLANGGIALATNSMAEFTTQLFAGSVKAESFTIGLLKSFGKLFKTTGTGLILLGLSTASIGAGIPEPLSLVGYGAGLATLGAGIDGFTDRGGGGSGASTASAVQSGYNQAADRLQDSRQDDRPIELFLLQEGLKRVVGTTVNAGIEDNSIVLM